MQAGLFIYLDGVADGNELLSRLIVHWFNGLRSQSASRRRFYRRSWDVWDEDVFSKTVKGILCPHIQGFDPFYTMYSIVTNMTFGRARSHIRVGHIE